MEVLTTNHYEKIMDLFEGAQDTIKIISPFISDSVGIKHHQKAHIRLSGNAKEFIDKRLDELENQYGILKYMCLT